MRRFTCTLENFFCMWKGVGKQTKWPGIDTGVCYGLIKLQRAQPKGARLPVRKHLEEKWTFSFPAFRGAGWREKVYSLRALSIIISSSCSVCSELICAAMPNKSFIARICLLTSRLVWSICLVQNSNLNKVWKLSFAMSYLFHVRNEVWIAPSNVCSAPLPCFSKN